MRTGPLTLLLSSILLSACDSPAEDAATHAAPRSAAGEVTFAVGPEIRSVPFHRAICSEDERGRSFVLEGTRALRTRAATERYPDVLIARFGPTGTANKDSSPDEGAILFAPGVTFEGIEHEMLTLIARSSEDGPAFECRVELEGTTQTVICNDAHVMPWKVPGPSPLGSFKASFECAAATERR